MSETSVVVTKDFGATRICEMGVVPPTDARDGLANLEYTDELNAIGSASFTIPTLHAKASEFLARGETDEPREIQVVSDGVIRFAGPIMATDANGPLTVVRANSLEQYLADRMTGPVATQLLTNNRNFELGDFTGWTNVGVTSASVVFKSPRRQRGDYSALLEHTTPGAETYIEQIVDVVNAEAAGSTREYVASVWYSWGPATLSIEDPPASGVFVPQVGVAILERGLFVRVENPIGTVWNPTTFEAIGDHVEPITRNDLPTVRFPRGLKKPRRFQVTLEIPTGTTSRIRFRAYIPWGLPVEVSSASLTRDIEIGVAPGEAEVDFTDLVETLFDYAMAKDSNLANLMFSGTATGEDTIRYWTESSNTNIFEAITSMTEEGHFDFWVDPATRTFTVYAPEKGSLKPKLVLELGKNIMDGSSFSINGGEVATSCRVLGLGDGPDREIGHAADTSTLGGLVVERSETMPDYVPLVAIDSKAASSLALHAGGVHTPNLKILDPEVAAGVATGDRVPVRVAEYGSLSEDANYRVIRKTVKPGNPHDDVTVTVQPA